MSAYMYMYMYIKMPYHTVSNKYQCPPHTGNLVRESSDSG